MNKAIISGVLIGLGLGFAGWYINQELNNATKSKFYASQGDQVLSLGWKPGHVRHDYTVGDGIDYVLHAGYMVDVS